MFRNMGRRLSRAVRNEGELEEGTQSQRRGSDQPAGAVGADGGSVGDEEESTPRPEPEPEPESELEPDAGRTRARSRSRRRTSTISRPPPPDLPSSGAAAAAGGKRVQWAPKNRIEHFEHVPLEEEESDEEEESRYVDQRMRELDEFGANPVVLARLHQALEPYSLPPGRERSRSTKESELQLPAYISQSKPAPRSKNIKKLLNYPRRSSTVSGRRPSHTKTAVQPPDAAESSSSRRLSTSASEDVQDKEKRAHEVEPEAVSDPGLDPDNQQRSQELHNQPVQRYYDLGHSQLSSVPDIEQEQPLPVSSRVHDWTQKTEGVQDWAKKAQTQAQTRDQDDPESVVEDTALEERGEQEKKWWENRAKGLVQAYSTRQRGSVPRTSVTRPVDDDGGGDRQQERQRQRRATKTERDAGAGAGETGRPRRGSRAAAATDLEAGQPGPLNEPLPLGRQHGVLGTLLTLYRNPELSTTMSSLESTGDETNTSDIQSLSEEEDRGGRRQRRDSERADKIGGEDMTRTRRRSSVRGRRPTVLPPAHVSPPSPAEEEEESSSSSLSSPEAVHGEEEEVQPSRRPVRDRRQTGPPPFYIPSSPEESTTPSPSPSPPETQAAPPLPLPPPPPPVPELARAPVPRKGSVRGRRQTGLPPLQFPSEQPPPPPPPPPEREPSPSITEGEEEEEEEAEPQGEPGKKTHRHPYARLIKKSLSASASVLHLPLSAHIPQPPIPAVTSIVPSRSSGGVVAALIATSNALAGPAAPRANTIAPDLTKRGYTLSRYRFSGGQQLSDARTATREDYNVRDRHERARAGERPSITGAEGESEGRLYRPRRGTSETGTTDTTLASSAETGAPKEEEEYPEKLTKKSSFAWLPGLLSRSGSRGSSIFGDREKEREKGASTDEYTSSQTSLSGIDQEALARRIEKRLNKRRRKEKRKMAQIYITKHIAEVLQRQEFMMKFARAHLMFAGPSHRLQGQLQATARVLDLQVSSVHFPNVILISFGDESTSTSMVKIIQQTSTLNLEKLSVMHEMFWKVIHDELSVSSASATLDLLMRSPSRYNNWQMVLTGGFASSAICTISFSGSFADALIVFPLGCLLVIVQLISAKHELYSNVFEITIATLLSFLSAALASSSKFCYAAIASSSVVLILPGFFVLSGSLELASKQIVSGAVRICFAVIYALFLGFGISIGAEVFTRITHRQVVGPDDFLCNTAHMSTDPWWQRKPSLWWAFLTVPLYSFVLTLRNHAPLFKRETLVTIVISCAGWTANHFAGVAFHNRPDLQSAIGAFAVGVIANLYARIFYGNAYVVMITGVLFQLPSGLANGGLLTFAKNDNRADNGFTSFESGFQVALQLIAVAIGLTVGLFTSVVVVHPLGGSRKGANAVFSL